MFADIELNFSTNFLYPRGSIAYITSLLLYNSCYLITFIGILYHILNFINMLESSPTNVFPNCLKCIDSIDNIPALRNRKAQKWKLENLKDKIECTLWKIASFIQTWDTTVKYPIVTYTTPMMYSIVIIPP